MKPFEERDNAMVMVGRISPEKRIENVIDAIALTETKPIFKSRRRANSHDHAI